MDRWFLIIASLFAVLGGILGVMTLTRGHRSRWTVVWMAATFICQIGFLSIRGSDRGACPLIGISEILVFLAWSLTLFYLIIGSTYRLSLLGVFSAPIVAIFQIIALLPGIWIANPQAVEKTSAWGETHSATSVLAYGAFALAAVAAVMFLVLDRQLKAHHLNTGLFRNMPPVRELLTSVRRLLVVGWALLTIGVVAGFLMPRGDALSHLIAAVSVWIAYTSLITTAQIRGLTGRRFSSLVVLLFIASLSVFALI